MECDQEYSDKGDHSHIILQGDGSFLRQRNTEPVALALS